MKDRKNTERCNTNPIGKIIRIILSLIIIGFGLYYKNPIGLLGFLTLYTAISGNCGFSVKFKRSKYDTKSNVINKIITQESTVKYKENKPKIT